MAALASTGGDGAQRSADAPADRHAVAPASPARAREPASAAERFPGLPGADNVFEGDDVIFVWDWRLPPGFPEPLVPPFNPMTVAKTTLGENLFFDERLSGNGSVSCATCHRPELAFTDGRKRPVGAEGDELRMNAPSLVNAAYEASLTWADGSVTTLEEQMQRPLLAEHPVEMGLAGREEEVFARLRADEMYAYYFHMAFPRQLDPFTLENVARAIASYERTLIFGRSPFDRLVFDDDQDALTEASRRGMRLFFSERVGCGGCHSTALVSGAVRHALAPDTEPRLFPVEPGTSRAAGTPPERVKAPSLRNVALTGPYMHDGETATLEKAALHAARVEVASAPPSASPSSTARDAPVLTRGELDDLLAFLEDLTDEAFAPAD